GMLLQFVNVKCFLYGITALSSFVLPYYSSPLAVALFVVLLSVIGFVSTVCWALFGAAFERFFQRHARLLNAAMALLLVWSAWTMVKELLV
ncbi:MAG: lysine transporter LysE, partial [Clostridiales bacterium]|nr:lysine transporter LysE [Clostridiales bacterium]